LLCSGIHIYCGPLPSCAARLELVPKNCSEDVDGVLSRQHQETVKPESQKFS
jgi:hypothetical protein